MLFSMGSAYRNNEEYVIDYSQYFFIYEMRTDRQTDRQTDRHGEVNMTILVIFSFEIIKTHLE
jgi:hypothetical protein